MTKEKWEALLAASRAWPAGGRCTRYEAMTPEEKSAMWEAQRQSWVRRFGQPHHGHDVPEEYGGAVTGRWSSDTPPFEDKDKDK